MERLFDSNIEITRRTLEKKEALILRLNKEPLTEEDIKHYSKVFGFDSDDAKAGRCLGMVNCIYTIN